MKIEKINEEITYKRLEMTVEFLVNGKKVRVYVHEDSDDMTGNDYDIDEDDLKQLTYLEAEAFAEEGLWNLIKMADGEIINLMSEELCPHEDDITYIDLLQSDGKPMYTVKCETCGEYGTIELIEGENTFGLKRSDINDLKTL